MKYTLAIILFNLFLLGSINAQSQKFELGIIGGANFSNLYANKTIDSLSKTKIGISQGILFQYNINSRFSINSKLLFERKGFQSKLEIGLTDEVGNSMGSSSLEIVNQLDYISLPILSRVYFGEKVKFFVNAGPYFSYLIDQKESQTGKWYAGRDETTFVFKNIKQFQRLDVGLSGGAGVFIPFNNKIGMTIEGGHNLGLTNISKNGKLKNSSSFALLGINYQL